MRKLSSLSFGITAFLFLIASFAVNQASAQSSNLDLTIPQWTGNSVVHSVPTNYQNLLRLRLENKTAPQTATGDVYEIQSVQMEVILQTNSFLQPGAIQAFSETAINLGLLNNGNYTTIVGGLAPTTNGIGLFEPIISNWHYELQPDENAIIELNTDFKSGLDTLGFDAVRIQVHITAVNMTTGATVTTVATGHTTYLKQCLVTEKADVPAVTLHSTPAFGVAAGTYVVKNVSPGPIEIQSCNVQFQGNIEGTIPKVNFLEVINPETGASYGAANFYGEPKSQFGLGMNTFVLSAGDSVTLAVLTNIPSMSDGDELFAAVRFDGALSYAPWGIASSLPAFVGSKDVNGQKVLFSSVSGISNAQADGISFINTGTEARITVATNESWNLDVYDITGKQVLSKRCTNIVESISKGNLSAGTYLASIKTNDATTTKKFVLIE